MKYLTAGFFTFIIIIGWNIVLIQRDKQLFKAYDEQCLQQPNQPQCRYSK